MEISDPNAPNSPVTESFDVNVESAERIVETVPISTVLAIAGVSQSISGVSVADAGGGSDTFTTLVSTANGGDVSASGSGGANVSGSGTGSLTISGTLSQVNTALLTLSYTNASAVSDTVTVKTSDPNASNSPISQNFYVTIHSPPTVSSVAVSSPGGSDLDAGKVVTFTLSTSAAVTVSTAGGAPTLALNDSEVATYSSGCLLYTSRCV